ncbi:MAG: helix-hairpin-helix domain-containing protein [Planctomycetota bacterium]|nr:MAG: helix-hairpin-helix domain-containing protein [Planctomycetota bacterium]
MTAETQTARDRHPQPAAAAGTALLLLAGLLAATWSTANPQPITRAELTLRINPNHATAAELQLLPGIGPTLAEYIVEYRENAAAKPAFRNADDLAYVHRIGPTTVERIREMLRFDSDEPPRDATP